MQKVFFGAEKNFDKKYDDDVKHEKNFVQCADVQRAGKVRGAREGSF